VGLVVLHDLDQLVSLASDLYMPKCCPKGEVDMHSGNLQNPMSMLSNASIWNLGRWDCSRLYGGLLIACNPASDRELCGSICGSVELLISECGACRVGTLFIGVASWVTVGEA